MSDQTGAGLLDGGRRRELANYSDARPRLLCVNDEPHALSALRRVLQDRFTVETSANVVEALWLLEQHGDLAVVIADVGMPEMNGFEFLEKVKEKSPTTTRLALTGVAGVERAAPPPGLVFRMLGKPCALEVLVEAISDAVSYHLLIATSPFQPVESPPRDPRSAPPDQLAPGGLTSWGQLPFDPSCSPAIAVQERSPAIPYATTRSSRIGLRVMGRTVELLPGVTLVGRSRTCHVPIDDAKVSRRHACFSKDERQLTVRNLSSTNPLLVNGHPLDPGVHSLEVGDRVMVASHEIEVCIVGDYVPSLEPTERISELAVPSAPPHEDEAVTLGRLADVAEKYMRLGQPRDAERVLRPPLEGLLRYCRSGQSPLASDIQLAVELALGIAESNRAGAWISYVFDLLTVLEQPATHGALERLYRVVPGTPGISMASYRTYVDVLAQRANRHGPAQQFLVRRVQGLESALLRSAHL